MVKLNNQAFNSTQQQANNCQFTENQSQFQEQPAPNPQKGLFSLPPSLMQMIP
jgi:hypothetical protein